MEFPRIEQACALCGAFVIKNDPRSKLETCQPPHAADRCPLRENPLQMISVLQTLNNELTTYAMEDIVHSSRLIRVALRKSLIECALHQSGAKISMNGSTISSFSLPPDQSQRAVEPRLAARPSPATTAIGLIANEYPNGAAKRKRRRTSFISNNTPTRTEHSSLLLRANTAVEAVSTRNDTQFEFNFDEFRHWEESGDQKKQQQQVDLVSQPHSPAPGTCLGQVQSSAALPTDPYLENSLQSFANDKFEGLLTDNLASEDIYDLESDYMKFISSLAVADQGNNTQSANENDLLLDEDDEEDAVTDEDDDDCDDDEPLEEYRDDPDVIVSDSELRELFEDEELDNIQNWNPVKEKVPNLVFDDRIFSDKAVTTLRHQLSQLYQLSLQGFATSHDISERNDDLSFAWKRKILELRDFLVVKPYIDAQLQSNLKDTSRFISAVSSRKSSSAVESLKASFGDKFDISVFPVFQNYYKPPKLRRFSEVENRLLTIGIYHYGASNWDFIREFLLPNRTEIQIFHRWRNLTRRRAEETPVKSMYFANQKLLTVAENKALMEACLKHGYNFIRIARYFFKDKPPSFLRAAWHRSKKCA